MTIDVHIVAQADDGWILGRCVDLLSRQMGWTVGPKARKTAQVNYYAPYLLYRGDPETKTAAWFTHREENPKAQGKAAQWERAAKEVSLRVAMSVRYEKELAAYGPACTISLPVDRKKFVPRPLVVGVAGQVYSLSRKGEEMVARLINVPGYKVVGAGKGWPCPTTFYPWGRMQEFYQQLDVFLVTGLVEGGPVTILEALACGVPVIAPKGVGMVDEFDLITYPPGDYDAMLKCLQNLQRGRLMRRRQVRDRTEQNYVHAHEKAFEALCVGSSM